MPKIVYNHLMIQLGTTVFDPTKQILCDAVGKKIALRAQALRVLECLLNAQGGVVSKDHLVREVWGKVAVTDDSLVQCIGEIRVAIGDRQHRVLQTELRRGYRLLQASPFAEDLFATDTPQILRAGGQAAKNEAPLLMPAVAVMAFASMDGNDASERLAQNFAGDLIAELAKQKALRVIGRFSSFSLSKKEHTKRELSTREVCDRLNARFLVTGHVQFSESTCTWSLEVMDGYNDEIIWSERKSVSLAELSAESEGGLWKLAGAICSALVMHPYRQPLALAPELMNAYDLASSAWAFLFRTTAEGTREAQRLAEQAVKLHPHYARAWYALAHAHSWDILHRHTGQWTSDNVGLALHEIRKCIELDASQPHPYGVLSQLLNDNGQHQEALLAAEQGLALNPSDPVVMAFHTHALFFSGRIDEAKTSAKMQLSLMTDRKTIFSHAYGRILLALGEREEAINVLGESLTVFPEHTVARMSLIVALEELGQHEKAGEHFKSLLAHTQGLDESYFGRRWSAVPEIRDRYLKAFRAHGLPPAGPR
jgi:DNA-binding winged helix-turn-helix (wHTH) protein/tetratricopeptide (TPR) repeat protein